MYYHSKKWPIFNNKLLLAIKMGPSAPMADRPNFEFSSLSERTAKRVV